MTQRALATPFHVDATGGIAYTEDPARIIQQRVVAAVGTQIGERVMRPSFGTDIISSIFEPMLPEVQADIRQSITDALSSLVPEVTVLDIMINEDQPNSTYDISIRYAMSNGTEGSAQTTVAAGNGG